MGILNVTPDSFSDGGRFANADAAIAHGLALAGQGAAILDVGGESTRPGSRSPAPEEEFDRVLPVIEGLRKACDVFISVDTSRPEIMRAAVAAGADMINDVRALMRPGALAAAAEVAVPVCLMHMQGEPATMQNNPRYDDVVGEVRAFLLRRAAECVAAGLPKERILLDPGFGFGKRLEHNLTLLQHLPELVAEGYPLLVGLSRKALLGEVLDRSIHDRLAGSLALAMAARQRGARVVRVHDVAATVDAFRMLEAVERPVRNGECEGRVE